jgi:hypothetical protein
VADIPVVVDTPAIINPTPLNPITNQEIHTPASQIEKQRQKVDATDSATKDIEAKIEAYRPLSKD